jgi:hypothetical protein
VDQAKKPNAAAILHGDQLLRRLPRLAGVVADGTAYLGDLAIDKGGGLVLTFLTGVEVTHGGPYEWPPSASILADQVA